MLWIDVKALQIKSRHKEWLQIYENVDVAGGLLFGQISKNESQ